MTDKRVEDMDATELWHLHCQNTSAIWISDDDPWPELAELSEKTNIEIAARLRERDAAREEAQRQIDTARNADVDNHVCHPQCHSMAGSRILSAMLAVRKV